MTDTVQIECSKLAGLVKYLGGAQKAYDAAKADFLKKLDKSPSHALEWSQPIMASSVTADEHNHWLNNILGNQKSETENKLTYDQIIAFMVERLTEEVIGSATSTPFSSSSPIANYMEQMRLSAKAGLLNYVKRGF